MLALPTSATTAIIIDPLPFALMNLAEYAAVALLFAWFFCAWEMLLATILGRRPARSQWLALVVPLLIFSAARLAEGFLTGAVDFNGGELSTTWGYILGAWLSLAFVLSMLVPVVLRILDAMRRPAMFGVPALAWWCAGCVLVSFVGVGLLQTSLGSIAGAPYITPFLAAGFALMVAGAGSLVAAAVIRWRRRSVAA